MIAFRVDANAEIATGHLYRCISIAEQLIKREIDVLFLISDDFCKNVLEEKKIEYRCLYNDFKNKEKELSTIIEIIENRGIQLFFIDSYQVTELYIKTLKQYVSIAYIDDLLSMKENVDIRIRPKFGCTRSEFTDNNIDILNSKLLLGSRFVPLRKQFMNKKIVIRENVKGVFITTGGTDNLNVINTILKKTSLLKAAGITKHITVGAFYRHMEELKTFAKNNDSIKIYQNISNIDEIMNMCDIGISAGGTTLAELCACGVATICFSIADNQMKGTVVYDKAGMMMNCGDYRMDEAGVIEKMENSLQLLLNNYDVRKQMILKATSKIDGNGAMRIAKELQTYVAESGDIYEER